MELQHNTPVELAYFPDTPQQIGYGGSSFALPVCLNARGCQRVAAADCRTLALADFQAAIDNGAEIIVIGTGSRQMFLPPQMMVQLNRYGIGLECMTTAAACRTFILLRGENRNVWAWLFA